MDIIIMTEIPNGDDDDDDNKDMNVYSTEKVTWRFYSLSNFFKSCHIIIYNDERSNIERGFISE